jgi:hypothetical protein
MNIENWFADQPILYDEIMKIHVECYAGYRGDETPRRFMAEGRQFELINVFVRWQTPDARFFKIRCNDENVYTLNRSFRKSINARHKGDVLRSLWVVR